MPPNISAVRRVLVVEDNPADVYLIRSALSEYSIEAEVDVLSDGESARSTAAEFQSGRRLGRYRTPRYQFAGSNGLELLNRMAQAPCPIVVMS